MPKKHATLTFHGQSSFRLEDANGHVMLIDPWLRCPLNPNGEADLQAQTDVDAIFITHGHRDHVADLFEVGKLSKPDLVGPKMLLDVIHDKLPYPKDVNYFGGEPGTPISLWGGDVTVEIIPAVHHNGNIADPATGEELFAGDPRGLIIRLKDGPTIYHMGDTFLFDDMNKITEPGEIDLMLTCIGGHYTMDAKEAAEAVKRIQPKAVTPMHYATMPIFTGTPEILKEEMEAQGFSVPVIVPEIGKPFQV